MDMDVLESEPVPAVSALSQEALEAKIGTSFWRDILYEIINTLDPWDIDISLLASRYSARVSEMEEMNFRIPANVVIVSSVLLRMKAQFVGFAGGEQAFSPDDFMDDSDSSMDGIDSQDSDLDSLIGAGNGGNAGALDIIVTPKRVLKRRITALELIAAIQEVLEDKAIKSRIPDKPVERNLVIAMRTEIKFLIEETYERVIGILASKDSVMFSELAQSREEIVSTLISLLHLSNNQRLKLRQEKLFDEIYIYH
jgi:chromatin segregation and condensation protein Rec8/ScpA/Scc1 (kleisin family)